jgi:hypothetical protein
MVRLYFRYATTVVALDFHVPYTLNGETASYRYSILHPTDTHFLGVIGVFGLSHVQQSTMHNAPNITKHASSLHI